MNWYTNITKIAQFDETTEISPRPLRYRGNFVFEVRIPMDTDEASNSHRAGVAAQELLTRVQAAVGDEVVLFDENSLERLPTHGY